MLAQRQLPLTMEFSISPFTPNNATDFCRLYRSVYGKSIDVDQVIRKFSGPKPMGSLFGYLAFDGRKPIAFYGAIPTEMTFGNAVEMAAQSADTMTHPDYRGKGLFVELAKLTYKQLENAGITFVWGFPNQNSESGFLKNLNWQYEERIRGFKIEMKGLPIGRFASKTPLFKHWYKRFVRREFCKYKADHFPSRTIPENAVTVLESPEYLNYKWQNGSFSVAISDCVFCLKMGKNLQIGSVEAANETDFQHAFSRLIQICKKCGIDEIIMQLSPKLPVATWLPQQNSVSFDSWIVGYRNFNSNFPLDQLAFTWSDVDTF